MGMTDKQFNAYLRLLLRNLKDVQGSDDPKYKEEKLNEIIETIQNTIES